LKLSYEFIEQYEGMKTKKAFQTTLPYSPKSWWKQKFLEMKFTYLQRKTETKN